MPRLNTIYKICLRKSVTINGDRSQNRTRNHTVAYKSCPGVTFHEVLIIKKLKMNKQLLFKVYFTRSIQEIV